MLPDHSDIPDHDAELWPHDAINMEDTEEMFASKAPMTRRQIIVTCALLFPGIVAAGWLIGRLIDLIAWSLGYGVGMMLNP